MTTYCLHAERQNTFLWFSARPTIGDHPQSKPQTLDKIHEGRILLTNGIGGMGLKSIAKAEFGFNMYYGIHMEKMGRVFQEIPSGLKFSCYDRYKVNLCFIDLLACFQDTVCQMPW